MLGKQLWQCSYLALVRFQNWIFLPQGKRRARSCKGKAQKSLVAPSVKPRVTPRASCFSFCRSRLEIPYFGWDNLCKAHAEEKSCPLPTLVQKTMEDRNIEPYFRGAMKLDDEE
ncbi:unnamed protein product [Blepharisma stoltei]|uniref:Uncharacterized protein n=1 Tax=Blepharisma stoltei TaxID=1481888 RepID=A0AAU9JDD6_9CILI|nr:unnamed protein product [Blepharisma stoltei]